MSIFDIYTHISPFRDTVKFVLLNSLFLLNTLLHKFLYDSSNIIPLYTKYVPLFGDLEQIEGI